MKSHFKKAIFFFTAVLTLGIWLAARPEKPESLITAKHGSPQPQELGKVQWLRSMADAQFQSKKDGKPILILFQEIPGCATCQRYGNVTLSHPLIVEAIETLFVPLAIYNNKQGDDAKILQYFNEPAWNNPVVRIVNADKRDVTPRLSGDYSPYGLVSTMLNALNISNKVAPRYLELLGEALQAERLGTEKATLGMYCFWTGEKELGKLPGVVSTEAGFMGGREVVQVEYNPAVISYEKLLKEADKSSCAGHVYTENTTQQQVAGQVVGKSAVSSKGNYRPDNEPKYYLSRTYWKYVPMTELQAARANSLVGQGQMPGEVLSPRQLELAGFIEKNQKMGWENVIGKEFAATWEAVFRKYSDAKKG
ncbi:MAG: VPGUxxT family thioredoxin-like (seleno)protein, type 2 [Saprospiraceae bacterium]